jgi:hypothetical protein
MTTFSASPNKARKYRKTNEDVLMPPSQTSVGVEEDWADDPNDDENVEEGEANPDGAPNRSWSKDYPRFSRNPIFVCLEDLYFRREIDPYIRLCC